MVQLARLPSQESQVRITGPRGPEVAAHGAQGAGAFGGGDSQGFAGVSFGGLSDGAGGVECGPDPRSRKRDLGR